MPFHLTAWVTIASLFTYIWMIRNVGRARVKFGIKAPEMNGPPEFLYTQRVQANTVEQMLLFFPALWLCAVCLGDIWAAAGGALWIAGRILYAVAYYRDPAKRGLGFGITVTASSLLMVGAMVGLVLK
ncbi:MAG: MAPEG family protein [Burkholderiales bacterium]|nr:MAPEG family protein [Burkholderiales bacterium]